MDKTILKELSAKAEIFKALAHSSRLFIVERLLEREYCVNELTELIGVEMPTISKHLSVLKNVGIIECRKERNNVYYKIKCSCVSDILACAEKMQRLR